MAGCGGIASVPVHLPEKRSDMRHIVMRIDAMDRLAGTADNRSFQVCVGHCEIGAVLSICSGNEYVKIFRKAQSPSVVAGSSQIFQVFAVWIKSVNTLAKRHPFTTHLAIEAGITHRSPNFIVQPIL